MSMFSKLAGLAQKALSDSGSGSSAQKSGSGHTDWRSIVRTAAEAITGEGSAGSTGAPGARTTDVAQPGRSARPASSAGARPYSAPAPLSDADRAAIARYDYLLETADPRQIEQVHREAFGRLNPAQREQIEKRMHAELPEHERPASSSAEDLARAAARTEAGRPGMLKSLLARVGGAGSGSSGAGRTALIGGAGLAAGGVLGAVAGGAIVSSVAGPILAQAMDIGVDFEALGAGLSLESLGFEGMDGLVGGVDEIAANAGESVSGLGDQVSGLGDQVGELGNGFSLDDLFGR